MTTEDPRRPDGGPLERSHMKDMVQRNAVEHAAYNKVTKHLENQKKAFVRQNTRDEGEMKNLLCRLQMEQQTALHDTDAALGSDFDDVDAPHSPLERLDQTVIANPYPITIVPKFGADLSRKNKAQGTKDVSHRPGSSRYKSRRKSVEYEDIQESLSSMTVSSFSSVSVISETPNSGSSSNLSRDDYSTRDWLATPGAISSVRRMRKSVAEQAHHRVLRKTSSEQLDHYTPLSSSPSSHNSSSFLLERKRSDSGDNTSPRLSHVTRRGGSLKERQTSKQDKSDHVTSKPLIRSYSVSSKTSVSEYRKLNKTSCAPSSESIDEPIKVVRKNSRKSLSRKLSNESTGSVDGTASPRRKSNVRGKLSISGSPESSPMISPFAKEGDSYTFKF